MQTFDNLCSLQLRINISLVDVSNFYVKKQTPCLHGLYGHSMERTSYKSNLLSADIPPPKGLHYLDHRYRRGHAVLGKQTDRRNIQTIAASSTQHLPTITVLILAFHDLITIITVSYRPLWHRGVLLGCGKTHLEPVTSRSSGCLDNTRLIRLLILEHKANPIQ